MDLTKKRGKWQQVCESAEKREKATQSSGTQRGRIQLEPFESSGLCLGITRRSCVKPYALFVRQPSATESCKKMGRRRQKSDVSRSARRRHFAGSNQRAPKKKNSRSSDVSGQSQAHRGELAAANQRRRHPSRQGNFKQRFYHGMAQQDKSSSLYMARRALPERRYGEL